MRTIIYILLAISLSLAFVSCSDDDNDNYNLEGSVWEENKDTTHKAEFAFYKNTCDFSIWFYLNDKYVKETESYKYTQKGTKIEFVSEHSNYFEGTIKNDILTISSTVGSETQTMTFIRK